MHNDLEKLMAQARSRSWASRSEAGRGLAMLDTPDVAAATLKLLTDPEDTAVGQATMRALLARQDSYGADLVFKGIAQADDDIAEHLLYFLALERTKLEGWNFFELARARAHHSRGLVKEGAAEVLEYLGLRTKARD